MPIVAADILMRISGGAAETDPNNALGGAMSTVGGGIVVTDVLNNDMDDITSAEASSGITIHHGYFWENTHGSLTYIAPKMYIDTQTASGDTGIDMAVAGEAKNLSIETVADEETPPIGEVFTRPANFAGGIAIGDLDAGDFRGWWAKYTVNVSASAILDTYTIGIQGDTNP